MVFGIRVGNIAGCVIEWTVVTLALLKSDGCLGSLVAHCDFELPGLCNWTRAPWADGPWRQNRGETDSPGTGPKSASLDYGGKYYVYLEASDFTNGTLYLPNKTVAFLMPQLSKVGCVAFLYMKFGTGVGTLRVGSYTDKDNIKGSLWEYPGKTDQTWQCEVQNITLENKQIYFEATSGENVAGDTALDSVFVFSEPCDITQNCTSFLNASAQPLDTTTQAPGTSSNSRTLAISTGPTLWTESNTQVSGRLPITTLAQSEEEFKTEFLLAAIIVPAVVLIAAIILAVLLYRRRVARREEELKRLQMVMANFPPPAEDYDLLDEAAMSPDGVKPQQVRKCTPPASNPFDAPRQTSRHN